MVYVVLIFELSVLSDELRLGMGRIQLRLVVLWFAVVWFLLGWV